MIGNFYLGFVLGKKIDSAEDFFLGRRTTPWWAIGISVIATYVSALSFLGAPAWSYARALPSFPEPVICQYWNNPNELMKNSSNG